MNAIDEAALELSLVAVKDWERLITLIIKNHLRSKAVSSGGDIVILSTSEIGKIAKDKGLLLKFTRGYLHIMQKRGCFTVHEVSDPTEKNSSFFVLKDLRIERIKSFAKPFIKPVPLKATQQKFKGNIRSIKLLEPERILLINNSYPVGFPSKRKGEKNTGKQFETLVLLWDNHAKKRGRKTTGGNFISLGSIMKFSEAKSENAAYMNIRRLQERFAAAGLPIVIIDDEQGRYKLIVKYGK